MKIIKAAVKGKSSVIQVCVVLRGSVLRLRQRAQPQGAKERTVRVFQAFAAGKRARAAVWPHKEQGGLKRILSFQDVGGYVIHAQIQHPCGMLGGVHRPYIYGYAVFVHGVRHLRGIVAAKPAAPAAAGSTGAAPLLERAFLFLEDGKWPDADTYCEKVLDIDPKNAQAYLGKLMAELQVSKRGQLSDCAQPFDKNENYLKILRFGDEALKTELCEYSDKRNKSAIYNEACAIMKSAAAQMAFLKGAELFKSISGFRDADALAAQCLEKAESCRKDAVYTTAISRMAVGNIASCEEAIAVFKTIPGWRDADSQMYACQKRIEEIKAKNEKNEKQLKRVVSIALPIICVCIAFVIVLTTVIIPQLKYNKAMNLLESGDYDSAYTLLKEFTYKDSKEKFEKYEQPLIRNAAVGDKITFGTYEQDNDTSNGAEEIEWLVLAKESNKLLVISGKALDCQKYNSTSGLTTWEECSLRYWLNDSFLNEAFSEEEQALIQSTAVSADKNPQYSTNPGNATTDKIFLLSCIEAEKYFATDNARQCSPTKYAYSKKVNDYTTLAVNYRTSYWWLRSPSMQQNVVAMINPVGSIEYRGITTSNYCYVRPALWISIE